MFNLKLNMNLNLNLNLNLSLKLNLISKSKLNQNLNLNLNLNLIGITRQVGGWCISDGVCFWRRNLGFKWAEKRSQISNICVVGGGRKLAGEVLTFCCYIWYIKCQGSIISLYLIGSNHMCKQDLRARQMLANQVFRGMTLRLDGRVDWKWCWDWLTVSGWMTHW